jgi:hypothetical protein
MEMNSAVLTIACNNHIAKAVTMARSARMAFPRAEQYMCLVERKMPTGIPRETWNRIVLAKDLGIGDFDQFIFSRTQYEAATALKASFLRYVLHSSNVEVLIYLDPDVEVFSPFLELNAALEKETIVLTPHFVEMRRPILDEVLISALKCGVFNLGFISIREGDDARRFLEWWEDILLRYCYVDFARGLFVDQKWIDFAQSLFPVTVITHPGYNVANWNLHERFVYERDGNWMANGAMVRFVHYSGTDSGVDMQRVARLQAKYTEGYRFLREKYLSKVRVTSSEVAICGDWTYGAFLSGEPITQEIRTRYRFDTRMQKLAGDPFRLSSEAFRAPIAG